MSHSKFAVRTGFGKLLTDSFGRHPVRFYCLREQAACLIDKKIPIYGIGLLPALLPAVPLALLAEASSRVTTALTATQTEAPDINSPPSHGAQTLLTVASWLFIERDRERGAEIVKEAVPPFIVQMTDRLRRMMTSES